MKPNHSRQSSCAKVLFDDSNYYEHKIKENTLKISNNFIYQSIMTSNKTEESLSNSETNQSVSSKKKFSIFMISTLKIFLFNFSFNFKSSFERNKMY